MFNETMATNNRLAFDQFTGFVGQPIEISQCECINRD